MSFCDHHLLCSLIYINIIARPKYVPSDSLFRRIFAQLHSPLGCLYYLKLLHFSHRQTVSGNATERLKICSQTVICILDWRHGSFVLRIIFTFSVTLYLTRYLGLVSGEGASGILIKTRFCESYKYHQALALSTVLFCK